MSETTELIKRLRQRGLSQTEISRRTGIPQPRLSRWENGDVPDAADDALRLRELDAQLTPKTTPSKARSTASSITQSDIDTYVRPCSRDPRRDGPSNRREER